MYLQNNEKIDHIINKCKTLEIDTIFLIEPNAKWTTHNKERVINKFKQMDRSAQLFIADSKEHQKTKNIWLQGRLIIVVWRRISNLIALTSIKIDKLGK